MPLYDYLCNACDHHFERTLKISEMTLPEGEACPSCNTPNSVKKTLAGAPAMGDPVRLGIRKPGGDFREVLQKIHERNYKSNLNQKF